MDNTTDPGAGRQRIFISHADHHVAERKAVFENQMLRLLSLSAEDYVATLDADRVMTALACHAASSSDTCDAHVAPVFDAVEDSDDHDISSLADDVLSRMRARRRSAGSAHASPRPTEFVEGAHNAKAIAAGRELIEVAAQRPPNGIRQILSGKGGSGKTEMLVHLACMAHQRGGMNVVVMDLGMSRTVQATMTEAGGNLAEADLVLIDNADRAQASPGHDHWWEAIERQIGKSTCVLVVVSSHARAAAFEPWQRLPEAWRKTEIGAFDCDFRRLLIGELSRRQQAERGGAILSGATIERLAEELWGNGWQLAEGVSACRSYANVMAKEPRPEQIDEIATNVVRSAWRDVPPCAAISVTSRQERRSPRHDSKRQEQLDRRARDVELYLTKTVTGQPLEQLSSRFGLRRAATVQAMRDMDHRLQKDRTLQQLVAERLARHEQPALQVPPPNA